MVQTHAHDNQTIGVISPTESFNNEAQHSSLEWFLKRVPNIEEILNSAFSTSLLNAFFLTTTFQNPAANTAVRSLAKSGGAVSNWIAHNHIGGTPVLYDSASVIGAFSKVAVQHVFIFYNPFDRRDIGNPEVLNQKSLNSNFLADIVSRFFTILSAKFQNEGVSEHSSANKTVLETIYNAPAEFSEFLGYAYNHLIPEIALESVLQGSAKTFVAQLGGYVWKIAPPGKIVSSCDKYISKHFHVDILWNLKSLYAGGLGSFKSKDLAYGVYKFGIFVLAKTAIEGVVTTFMAPPCRMAHDYVAYLMEKHKTYETLHKVVYGWATDVEYLLYGDKLAMDAQGNDSCITSITSAQNESGLNPRALVQGMMGCFNKTSNDIAIQHLFDRLDMKHKDIMNKVLTIFNITLDDTIHNLLINIDNTFTSINDTSPDFHASSADDVCAATAEYAVYEVTKQEEQLQTEYDSAQYDINSTHSQ